MKPTVRRTRYPPFVRSAGPYYGGASSPRSTSQTADPSLAHAHRFDGQLGNTVRWRTASTHRTVASCRT